jgi:hypothetical protein
MALTLSGAPDSTARYASMTAVLVAAAIYFGRSGHFGRGASTRRERWILAYGLIAPYALVETAGLGYTWWSGVETIFHAAPYTLGTPIGIHFFGHIIGGLTWEPALVYFLIGLVGTLGSGRGRQEALW